jgi:hypothetical protein
MSARRGVPTFQDPDFISVRNDDGFPAWVDTKVARRANQIPDACDTLSELFTDIKCPTHHSTAPERMLNTVMRCDVKNSDEPQSTQTYTTVRH